MSSKGRASLSSTMILLSLLVQFLLLTNNTCLAWTTKPTTQSSLSSLLYSRVVSRKSNNAATAAPICFTRLFSSALESTSQSIEPAAVDGSSNNSNSTSTAVTVSKDVEANQTGEDETTTTSLALSDEEEDEYDEDDYEYIEYDMLKEEDFLSSEWFVGTNWNNKKDKIDETWVRLICNENDRSQNVAIWGDGSQGKWSLDVASQYLSISKENKLFGKQLWAGIVNDYYFLQGTVRGWSFLEPASALAQWQAKRLGLDENDDPGVAPWFEEEEEEDSDDNDEDSDIEAVAKQD